MKTLVVIPTLETRERLQEIMGSAPFTVDWETLLVPLAHIPSGTSVTPTNTLYEARFKSFQVMFDRFRQSAELVGVLDSPGMLKRSIDCGMGYEFLLKLVFLPYAPAQSQPIRNFIVSVSDILVIKEEHKPFTFQREFILGE
jgi:hypothetical protein